MPIKVKTAAEAAGKWVDNAGRASTAAVNGALAAAQDWANNTANSADNFKQAITAPGIDIRFRTGVTKAGAEKYARKVKELTGQRFGSGVTAGKSDYQGNVDPYLQTISQLSLPPARPRGDVSNYDRSKAVGTALNAKRLALMGVGA